MVSVLSQPDPNLLVRSHGALTLCYYPGRTHFRVFQINKIQAVVAALPHPELEGYYSILEQLGHGLEQDTGVNIDHRSFEHGDDGDEFGLGE